MIKDLSLYIQGLLSEADEIGNIILNLKRNRLGSNLDNDNLERAKQEIDIYDLISEKLEIVKVKLENIN